MKWLTCRRWGSDWQFGFGIGVPFQSPPGINPRIVHHFQLLFFFGPWTLAIGRDYDRVWIVDRDMKSSKLFGPSFQELSAGKET